MKFVKSVFIIILVVISYDLNAQLCFSPKVDYTVGASPNGIVSADFNNDGKLDLAAANATSNSISLRLGVGNGTFGSVTDYTVSVGPPMLFASDINGDSNMDLITILSDQVAVLLGNGTGAFGSELSSSAGVGIWDLAIKDINGDNKMDVVTANSNANNISVLTGIGNGLFNSAVNYNVGTTPEAIAFGDFNSDGTSDLVVGNKVSNDISILIGNSNGTFGAANTFSIGNNWDPDDIVTSDYNNDAKNDFAVYYKGVNISVYLGNGNGTFVAPSLINLASGSLGSLNHADFNSDGFLDIVLTEAAAGAAKVYLGLGNGTFGTPFSYPTGTFSRASVVGDFNSDAIIDLAVVNAGVGNFSVLLNQTRDLSITGVTSPVCQFSSVQLTASGANNYQWSTGATTQVLNINPSATTTYTVTDADGCGFATFIVNVIQPTQPSICMVSVDEPSNFNEIYWDKTLYPNLDSMVIWRETTSNTYKRIGAVHQSALSMYIDTARSIGPANGNPNIGTYRYKIQMRDTCGNYSAMSLWHNTVFFINSNGTFFWNEYKIEGDPIPTATTNPMTQFDLVRDDFAPTGNYNTVGSVAGTQTTLNDPFYPAFQTTADWRVYAYGLNCEPTMRIAIGDKENDIQTVFVKSKSNIKNNRAVGIQDNKNQEARLKVYPNPANGLLNVEVSLLNDKETTINIENMLGQVVYTSEIKNQKSEINISTFISGVYFVKVNTGKVIVVEKVIIE